MSDKHESEGARLDRKLIEILNEIRVALPGVQVLMAFLLIAPLNAGWSKTTGTQHLAYAIALLSAAFASILLITPSSYHRLRFKRLHPEGIENKKNALIAYEHLTIGGFFFLSISILASVWLSLDYVFGWLTASTVIVWLAAAVGWFWYGLPLGRRFHDPEHKP
jgi:hypothetical protein